MLILGFGNKARQGKDTAAEAIKTFYDNQAKLLRLYSIKGGLKVGIFKFATALYEEVNEFLRREQDMKQFAGIDVIDDTVVPEYHGRIPEWVQREPNPEISTLAPYGKHPKLLQWWGTEYRRTQDPNYWTDKLFASIPSNLDIALVTDVRFPNEADGIKQRGGYNIQVRRLNEDGGPFYSIDRPQEHPSEIALDYYNWDFRIANQHGHPALLGEVAITHVEYLRALGPSK